MLLPLLALSTLHLTAADSVTGAWRINAEVSGVAWAETCTLKQAGAALSGSCVGESGPAVPVTGEVKDGKVTFRHGTEYNGQQLTLVYSGTLAARALKGTVEAQPLGASGEFTAAPAAAPAPGAAPAKP